HRCHSRTNRLDTADAFECDSVASLDSRGNVDDYFACIDFHDRAELDATVVRLVARYVVATRAPLVHSRREAATEDLNEILDFLHGRRGGITFADTREKIAVAARDRRYVLGPLLAPFYLEATHAGVGDVGKRVVRTKILRRYEKARVERLPRRGVGECVILATRLRTGAAIGAALGDHSGHVALPAVRDAQRAVNERFQSEPRHRGMNRADVLDRILASQHDAIDPQLLHQPGTGLVVHGHLGRAMNLEPWIHDMNQLDESDVLHDRRVDPSVDRLAQKIERLAQLRGLDERVEREVDPSPARVRQRTRRFQLVQSELRAFVPRVELLRAKVHGVGAVRDSGPDGVQGARGRE